MFIDVPQLLNSAVPVAQVLGLMAIRVLLIIALFVALRKLIHRYIKDVVSRVIRSHRYASKAEEEQREESIASILRTASTVILAVIALFSILSVLGVNLAGLLTGAGLIGIIVGFGAQGAIKNFLGGIFIIMENQYRVGDIVTLHGSNPVSGVVESLTIRVTKLRDLDGNQHTVQNGDIAIVTNMSIGFANVNVDVAVAYESDLDRVINIINKVGQELAEDKDWKDQIVEPVAFLRVDAFGDSAIIMKSVGKVMPGKQWDVAGAFRYRLKKAFDAAGVVIPFQQRVVHMIPEEGEPEKHSPQRKKH